MLTLILWLGFLFAAAFLVLMIVVIAGYIVLVANGIKSLLS